MRVGCIGLICGARLPNRDLLLSSPTYLDVVELLAAEHLALLPDVQGALWDSLKDGTETWDAISGDGHIALERVVITL